MEIRFNGERGYRGDNRTYEVVPILLGSEELIGGEALLQRSHQQAAYLGADDANYVHSHEAQVEICDELRYGLCSRYISGSWTPGLLFPAFTKVGESGEILILSLDWNGSQRIKNWYRLDGSWGDHHRLVRRVN